MPAWFEGEGELTNLVEHKHELLAPSVEALKLLLDGPAPGPDRVTRVEDLDQHVARLEHLAEAAGMQLERGVVALLLGVRRVVLEHGVLTRLRVGSERGRERGS